MMKSRYLIRLDDACPMMDSEKWLRIEILLDKYMNQGITEVEDIKVLSLADFANYGKPAKIVKLFGGKMQYEQAVKELEEELYGIEVG